MCVSLRAGMFPFVASLASLSPCVADLQVMPFLAGAADRRILLACHLGRDRLKGCGMLLPCNACRLVALYLTTPTHYRTYPLCLPVDKSLSVAEALGR
jgi:hypothetical protein